MSTALQYNQITTSFHLKVEICPVPNFLKLQDSGQLSLQVLSELPAVQNWVTS